MTGETSATNAGTHMVYCTPTGKCSWADGTQDSVAITWTMDKAALTLSASISGAVTYNTTATITVVNSGNVSITATSSNTNAVTVERTTPTSVTVRCVGYSESAVTITISAAEITNYLSASTPCYVTTAKASGSVTLSATSGTVTYGTPATFTVTNNLSGRTLSVSSESDSYVTATLSGTTVTLNCLAYHDATVAITVNSAETVNYTAATATYTFTTARAKGTLSISKTSMSLTTSAPSDTTTVTTNSNGTITATPADISVCNATVSDTTVTIKGKNSGPTTVTIAVAQSDQYTAPTSKTVSVSVPTAILTNMTDGTSLAQIQQIFANGQGSNYFKAGDYFDITFPSEITLDSRSIAADSTWRVVCLGIDHNSSKEGTNRGHF